MIVSELIEKLKQLPSNADVWCQGEGNEMNDVAIVDYNSDLNFVHLLWSQAED
jgi:hypothetical protein